MNLLPLLMELGGEADIVKLELLTSTFRFQLPRYDQTRSPVGECGIEIVVRKRTQDEMERGGRFPSKAVRLDRELRIHLNQYIDDADMLRAANADAPPFTNDKELP
jgi:hypothetical protein